MLAFSCIFIGYLFIDLSSSTIKKIAQRVALEAATRFSSKTARVRRYLNFFLEDTREGLDMHDVTKIQATKLNSSDVNFCNDHCDKIEVPDPLAVEDLISSKLNN